MDRLRLLVVQTDRTREHLFKECREWNRRGGPKKGVVPIPWKASGMDEGEGEAKQCGDWDLLGNETSSGSSGILEAQAWGQSRESGLSSPLFFPFFLPFFAFFFLFPLLSSPSFPFFPFPFPSFSGLSFIIPDFDIARRIWKTTKNKQNTVSQSCPQQMPFATCTIGLISTKLSPLKML